MTHRDAQGPLLAVVLGDVNPSDRQGAGSLEPQALSEQFQPGFGGVTHHPVDARRVLALVLLRHPPDRQELGGRGPGEELLKALDPHPILVLGGAADPLLQTSDIRLHRVPIDVGPRGKRLPLGRFDEWLHRLTSPRARTSPRFPAAKTRRKSAPFQVGYPCSRSPVRPVTGRPSLFPTSFTLRPVPRPCGRDTTVVGGVGLTQLSLKKDGERLGWSLYPGGDHRMSPSRGEAGRTGPRTILVTACQPLWPFRFYGAYSALHLRSTSRSFPSRHP